MASPVPARKISVTEAIQRGVSGLISDAEIADVVVTTHGRPVAFIISAERFQLLDRQLEDLRDLTLAASRIALGERASVPFDELLKAYGLTYADLAALPDDQTLAADD